MKKGMKASTLQVILIVCIIASLLVGAGGFIFAKSMLTNYAVLVSHAIGDSKASADNVTTLKALQNELASQQANEAKASLISSPVASFQNQVITDLDNYARYTGINVTNFSFTAPAATAAPTTTPAATATPAVAAAGTSLVTITIASPVSYLRLVKFIRAVETNLPKMQISSINIGRSDSNSSDEVTTDTLTIAVFTK